MGQSSSQVAPTQTQHPPQSPSPTSRLTRKRPPIDTENGEMTVHRVKKVRLSVEGLARERRAHRAVPQHRRGTAIRPSLDPATVRPTTEKDATEDTGAKSPSQAATLETLQSSGGTDGTVAQDTVAGAEEGERRGPHNVQHEAVPAAVNPLNNGDAGIEGVTTDTVHEHGTSEDDDAVTSQGGKLGTARSHAVKETQPAKETPKDATSNKSRASARRSLAEAEVGNIATAGSAVLHDDNVIVNPIGQPGPQRKKKKQKTTRFQVSNADAPVQQEGETMIPDPEMVTSIDSPVRNPVSGNDTRVGVAPQIEQEALKQSNDRSLHARDQNISSQQPTQTAIGADGIAVSAVGKPGPKRKKRKTKSVDPAPELNAQNIALPDRDTEKVRAAGQSQNERRSNGQESTEVNAKHDLLPARKKSRIQHAASTQDIPAERQAQEDRILPRKAARNLGNQPSVGADGVAISAIGRPGPKRKTRKERRSEATRAHQAQNAPQHIEEVPQPERPHEEVPEDNVSQDEARPLDTLPLLERGMLTPPSSPEEEPEPEEMEVEMNQGGDDGSEHDPEYDARDREGYVDPSDQIMDWLKDSQDLALGTEQGPPARHPPTQSTSLFQERPALRQRERVQYYDSALTAKDPLSNLEVEVETGPEVEAETEVVARAEARKKPSRTKPKQSNKKTSKLGRVAHNKDADGDAHQDQQSTDGESELESTSRTRASTRATGAVQRQAAPTKPTKASSNMKQTMPEESFDSRPVAMKQYQTAERGTRNGQWSYDEIELAEETFSKYCQTHKMDEYELKCNFLDWTNVGSFKGEIYDAFPQRKIDAIRRFCQRHFDPFKQGPWSAEEDEKLKKAYVEYPDQWTIACDLTGRSAQACRDRWQNIVRTKGTQKQGPWSTDEEDRLVEIVKECIETCRQDCEDDEVVYDAEKLEAMIHWKTVEDKMKGTRSAKRCSEKWQRLKRRPKAAGRDGERDGAVPQPWNDKVELSRKQNALETEYLKLATGDMYDALTDICAAMEGRYDNEVFHDESTFWSIVSTSSAGKSRFSGALMRRAYYGALERYSCQSAKEAKGIARKAKVTVQQMLKLVKRDQLQLTRMYKLDWVPEEPGKAEARREDEQAEAGIGQAGKIQGLNVEQEEAEKAKKRLAKKRKRQSQHSNGDAQRNGRPAKKMKSEAFVVDSDDEPDETGAISEGNGAAPQRAATEVPRPQRRLRFEEHHQVIGAEQQDEERDVDDVPESAIRDYPEGELSDTSPELSPKEFMRRCREAGRKQHRQYLKRKNDSRRR